MKIRLIAVGTRVPDWVERGFADYAKRLPRECRLELVEIAAADRARVPDIARCRQAEAARILKAVQPDDHLVALDERGDALDTQQWSQALKGWMQDGRDAALVIGGPDGLAPEVLDKAKRKWSLSRLTLPHALVRVPVAEQLYRAWTRIANHPYHRA